MQDEISNRLVYFELANAACWLVAMPPARKKFHFSARERYYLFKGLNKDVDLFGK